MVARTTVGKRDGLSTRRGDTDANVVVHFFCIPVDVT
jgi:hypothetical protein